MLLTEKKSEIVLRECFTQIWMWALEVAEAVYLKGLAWRQLGVSYCTSKWEIMVRKYVKYSPGK